MSVLIRLSGDSLDVDHQFGREYLTSLAALRPLIGAVFAVLLYFAFKGNLVKQVDVSGHGAGEFAFFVTASFAIGFSERFAKQIVRTAEAGAGGSPAPATPAAVDHAGDGSDDLGAEIGAQGVERGAQRLELGAQRGHLVLQPPDARVGGRRGGGCRRHGRRWRAAGASSHLGSGRRRRPLRRPDATGAAGAPGSASSSPSRCA